MNFIVLDCNTIDEISKTQEGLAVSQKLAKALLRYSKYLADNKIEEKTYTVVSEKN